MFLALSTRGSCCPLLKKSAAGEFVTYALSWIRTQWPSWINLALLWLLLTLQISWISAMSSVVFILGISLVFMSWRIYIYIWYVGYTYTLIHYGCPLARFPALWLTISSVLLWGTLAFLDSSDMLKSQGRSTSANWSVRLSNNSTPLHFCHFWGSRHSVDIVLPCESLCLLALFPGKPDDCSFSSRRSPSLHETSLSIFSSLPPGLKFRDIWTIHPWLPVFLFLSPRSSALLPSSACPLQLHISILLESFLFQPYFWL